MISPGEENDAEELFEFYDNGAPQQDPEEPEEEGDSMEDSFEESDPSDPAPPFPVPDFSHLAPAPAPAPAPVLGRFMTPQLTRVSNDQLHGRHSVGPSNAGGATVGPRRVKIVEPWKVEDLVVPVKQEEKPESLFASPQRQRLTEDEKRVRLNKVLHVHLTFSFLSFCLERIGYSGPSQKCSYYA